MRVLEPRRDSSVPLLERVKFCSIFSSDLDEFFMVRVAGLMGQLATGVSVRSADGRTPQRALDEIQTSVAEQAACQAKLWRRDLKRFARVNVPEQRRQPLQLGAQPLGGSGSSTSRTLSIA